VQCIHERGYTLGENISKWTIWIVTIIVFLDYEWTLNIKSYSPLNFEIIHVVIDYNESHIKEKDEFLINFWNKDIFLLGLLHPNSPWCHSIVAFVLFLCLFKYLRYLYMENHTLDEVSALKLTLQPWAIFDQSHVYIYF
jgi:hypothetical protein